MARTAPVDRAATADAAVARAGRGRAAVGSPSGAAAVRCAACPRWCALPDSRVARRVACSRDVRQKRCPGGCAAVRNGQSPNTRFLSSFARRRCQETDATPVSTTPAPTAGSPGPIAPAPVWWTVRRQSTVGRRSACPAMPFGASRRCRAGACRRRIGADPAAAPLVGSMRVVGKRCGGGVGPPVQVRCRDSRRSLAIGLPPVRWRTKMVTEDSDARRLAAGTGGGAECSGWTHAPGVMPGHLGRRCRRGSGRDRPVYRGQQRFGWHRRCRGR